MTGIDYPSVRNASNTLTPELSLVSSWKFNSRLSISQSAVYTAEIADLDRFNFVAGAALDTKLSDQLIWRLGADYTYENQPAAQRGHHDTTLVSSIAVKF